MPGHSHHAQTITLPDRVVTQPYGILTYSSKIYRTNLIKIVYYKVVFTLR